MLEFGLESKGKSVSRAKALIFRAINNPDLKVGVVENQEVNCFYP